MAPEEEPFAALRTKEEASLRPLQLGSIVRVSNVHLNKALRRAITASVKRAKDMVTWSADLYYVAAAPAHGPLQAAAGNADARPHYTVLPVGLRAAESQALSVPRQDLLAATPEPVSAEQLERQRDGHAEFLASKVTARPGAALRHLSFM